MLHPSYYFQWKFCAILVILLLHPAQGNLDEIYTEMHGKLLHFQNLAQVIVEKGTMNSLIKEAYDERVKNIKKVISRNAEISKLMEKWRNGEIESLDDYLALRQKVNPLLIEKMRKKGLEIRRPLNENDGKYYYPHELEKIQKYSNEYLSLLKFLEVTCKENAVFFGRLLSHCSHYLTVDNETKNIENTYIDLYDYVYLMGGIKLLKEHGVVPAQQQDGVQHQHNVHSEHPAVVDQAKQKNVDHVEMINIWALTRIVNEIFDKLEYFYYRSSAKRLKIRYPTLEQQKEILAEANNILEASKAMLLPYSAADYNQIREAKSRYEHELDRMLQVKRVEKNQVSEYFAELVFDEWAKNTNLGTIKSETYDADTLMAEVENTMEKMKIGEEVASSNSNTWDLKADVKGADERVKRENEEENEGRKTKG